MHDTIQKLLAPGKGILAADESTGTITKRFAAIGLTSTPELNKKYREMLFNTPEIEKYISGVILYKESVEQNLHQILAGKGIVLGIKLDGGREKYKDTEQEISKEVPTLPLDLRKYFDLGFRFAKWRGLFTISDLYPSDEFFNDNLGRMANYALECQKIGIVPIVEPEVSIKGNHTTTRCAETTTKMLQILFSKLKEKNIDLSNLILKTNMVLPGSGSGVVALPLEVANATLRTLRNSVPSDVGGIVFLSGGQNSWDAIEHLDKIQDLAVGDPWKISFSFSRALQGESQKVWAGKDENISAAQTVFLGKLKEVSLARQGKL